MRTQTLGVLKDLTCFWNAKKIVHFTVWYQFWTMHEYIKTFNKTKPLIFKYIHSSLKLCFHYCSSHLIFLSFPVLFQNFYFNQMLLSYFIFSLSPFADERFSTFSIAVFNLDSCSMSTSSSLVHTCSLSL